MSKGKVVIGVLAGVAVGALLGVLFAPDKGTETRKKIAGKASDPGDTLKDVFAAILAGLQENARAGKDEADDLYKKGDDNATAVKAADTNPG
jgi:gas vesicle protein